MKYIINKYNQLLIHNDSNKRIFSITKNNKYWFKWEYDHNGKYIYYEDDDGYIINYDI